MPNPPLVQCQNVIFALASIFAASAFLLLNTTPAVADPVVRPPMGRNGRIEKVTHPIVDAQLT